MKAQELRIGNFVRSWFESVSCKVEQVGELIYYTPLTGNEITDSCDVSKILPIPLTEEWILRMGFDNKHCSVNFKTFYNDGFDYRIELYSDGKCLFDELREIQHVHQLQNLYFALTGEELAFDVTKS